MDSVQALNIIRDTLRSNLTDVYVLAGGNSRTWIYTDIPLAGATYPRIQIKKLNNPVNIIDIGTNYMEHEMVFANCWVYSKNNFKVTISGTEYKNEQLVEYLLGQIGSTLKSNQDSMYSSGVGGYKKVNTTDVGYDPETQLHFAAITVRVWFFKR